ncbi:MAG TPA: hypothetical protein VFV03_07775 [Solirubrobacteraceae bacterium]|nr:hypothetical protein [Solirubrobacteraceae bacterium]
MFGLDVYAEQPIPFLERSRAAASGRELFLHGGFADATAAGWPGAGELLCDERERDDTINFQIEAHPEAGYLIWGPSYGANVLSADGRTVSCAPGASSEAAWQRLLVAQVLPFAAVLSGLEVLHSSAVLLDGRAIACLGPSRAGKTSVALELCRRGASFLTDDVLAIECRDGALIGHPGSPVASLDHEEAARIEGRRSDPLTGAHDEQHDGQLLGVNSRERLVHVPAATEPAPLEALFFLDRRSGGPEQPRFEAIADARALLAATFNFVLRSPERLRGLLDVCALAAGGVAERIVAGPAVDASRLGEAIVSRLERSP